MKLPPDILEAIKIHAEQAYPEECCGVGFSKTSPPDELIRLKRCTNAQNTFHRLDPIAFPRTSRNAYFIDPKDLFTIERECRERDEHVCLIYHSHPDVGVYFSDEDQRRAVVDGEPLHPGVEYLVVSVRNGKAEDVKLFGWDTGSGSFVEQVMQTR